MIAAAAEKKAKQAKWEAANPELAAKLKLFFSKDTPDFDFASVQQKEKILLRVLLQVQCWQLLPVKSRI